MTSVEFTPPHTHTSVLLIDRTLPTPQPWWTQIWSSKYLPLFLDLLLSGLSLRSTEDQAAGLRERKMTLPFGLHTS